MVNFLWAVRESLFSIGSADEVKGVGLEVRWNSVPFPGCWHLLVVSPQWGLLDDLKFSPSLFISLSVCVYVSTKESRLGKLCQMV